MKIYYMRDNHTFLPLPLDVDMAELALHKEFDAGYTYGMLCSKSAGMETPLHARGNKNAEEFFSGAREWIQRAIEHSERGINMNRQNVTEQLRQLIADWRSRRSLTGDCAYDIGCDNTAESLADELEDIINKVVATNGKDIYIGSPNQTQRKSK